MRQNIIHLIETLCLLVLTAIILSCSKDNPEQATDYSDASMWCYRPTECKSATDVFYIVSTMIQESKNPDGSESYFAVLTEEEKQILKSEIDHVYKDIIPDGVNYFSPYYHQMTLSSINHLTKEQIEANAEKVKKEVCEAFDYYMANCNNGRPFMLVGYSQGALMVKTLVLHMTDEQYERMIAGYMMGLGLNDEDLKKPHMKKATGPTDTGSLISWNSVKNVEAIFSPIWANAVTCMNPISWNPDDAAPVKYTFGQEELTIHVDLEKHVLIVEGFNPDNHPELPKFETPWSKENYHDYETYLYNPSIRKNMQDRITAFGK